MIVTFSYVVKAGQSSLVQTMETNSVASYDVSTTRSVFAKDFFLMISGNMSAGLTDNCSMPVLVKVWQNLRSL